MLGGLTLPITSVAFVVGAESEVGRGHPCRPPVREGGFQCPRAGVEAAPWSLGHRPGASWLGPTPSATSHELRVRVCEAPSPAVPPPVCRMGSAVLPPCPAAWASGKSHPQAPMQLVSS